MDTKLPYYMVYPLPFPGETDRRDRMDFEYLKSMYPDAAKQLLPYIEDECDRMEYEGSMLFDEYPDPLQMMLMGKRICDRVKKNKVFGKKEQLKELRDLIQVMLYQEIYTRRSDHRKQGRRYYQGIDF